jgi:adenylate cyclase
VLTATGATLPSRHALLRFAQPTTDAAGVRSTFTTYSFFDVLLSSDQVATGAAPAVPASAFAGKLVFVGASAAAHHDRYQTPFGGGMGGVELQAILAANVLSSEFMRRSSRAVDVAVTAGAALVAAALAVGLPVLPATLAVLGASAGLILALTMAVGRGHWLPAVDPVLAALAALFLGVAWQYFVEGRQKREIKRLFGRYVSKDVIDELLANPALAALGGQRRTMTVLFSDIRGFTTAAERATPEAVVAQLNEYFEAMVEVLFRHRGTLDKFVGDMVMGLFGAPLDDADHADHAVAAAVEMIETLERLNARWRREGRPVLDIGIGINTGEMIAGNVGAEAIMSYTVIGDAVNLGARLESLNKELGTRILISEATRVRLRQPVATRPKGAVTVKGKTEAVLVHEVTGRPAGDDSVGETET